jgi:hypothetical protein
MGNAVREVWARRIEQWKESGLTAAEFASESGVNARSLSWWRWRLSSGEKATAKKRTRSSRPRSAQMTKARTVPPLSFVEMSAAIVREPLEVVLPSTVRVRVPIGFDDTTLGRLLDLLERRR